MGRKSRDKRINRLRREAEELVRRGLSEQILIEPDGSEKMSEVLERFIEPYARFATTLENHRMLLTLAVTAWNMSLYPDEEHERILGELGEGLPMIAGLKPVLAELIERKRRHFSSIRRLIITFNLTGPSDNLFLTVASTVMVDQEMDQNSRKDARSV